ncbi:MAG: ArnT family glycosyltransferase [Candidatus Sumerlaeaceae bacterium]
MKITMGRFDWRSERFLLFLILLLAAILRLVRLDALPPAMFRDEAEKAYNAYSILKTGRDIDGRLLPIFIHVFGVTTSAIYQYAAIPFIAALGLNEWSARLPAAAAGIATIGFTFLVMRILRGSRTALWAAFLLALSPWHIVFSRWAQQGIFVPLLLSIGAYGLARYTSRANPRKSDMTLLLIGTASMGFATYVYDVARLFVPLLLLVALITYWRQLSRAPLLLGGTVVACLIGALPTLYLLFFQSGSAHARFGFVSILQPGIGAVEIVRVFFMNYVAHWSPQFLLLHGDSELRHGPQIGVLTLLEILGLVAGGVVLLRDRSRANWFWIGWLLLFPVAASLTRIGIPHALRCIVALPALQIVAAIGLETCTQHIRIERRRAFQQLLVLLAFLTFVPFGLRYYSHQYALASAFNWQYGLKESLKLCNEGELRDARVYMHNIVGAEYLVPFYLGADPNAVQSVRRTSSAHFGRFVYLPFQQEDRLLQVSDDLPAAYITPPGRYSWPRGWRPLAIFPAHDENYPPVLYVYLNPALRAKLEK